MKNTIEILRAGINSTLQDEGRFHQYHIGLPISGAIDKRNYLISNHLVGNKSNTASLEFAYQGPLLKLKSGRASVVITGCLLYTSPSPRDGLLSRMPSSA